MGATREKFDLMIFGVRERERESISSVHTVYDKVIETKTITSSFLLLSRCVRMETPS